MKRVGLASVALAAALLATSSSAWALSLSQSEIKLLKSILPHITYVGAGVGGKPTIQFSGVNVQIVNGVGRTNSTTGAGNLVIGYDENTGVQREVGEPPVPGLQTGSHNLILGTEQEFTSYGGILAGQLNSIRAQGASVIGGFGNIASSRAASVSGGDYNVASGPSASVSGGQSNTAVGTRASVSGGDQNTASGEFAS